MGIQMRCHFVPILIRSEAFWLQRGGVHFAIVLPNGNTLLPTREAGLVQIANALIETHYSLQVGLSSRINSAHGRMSQIAPVQHLYQHPHLFVTLRKSLGRQELLARRNEDLCRTSVEVRRSGIASHKQTYEGLFVLEQPCQFLWNYIFNAMLQHSQSQRGDDSLAN